MDRKLTYPVLRDGGSSAKSELRNIPNLEFCAVFSSSVLVSTSGQSTGTPLRRALIPRP